MKRSRLRVLFTPTVLVTAFLVLVGGMGFVHVTASKQAWQDVLAQADAWQREIESRDRTREVLWGESVEGEAWPHYERAMTHTGSIHDANARSARAWWDHSDGKPSELEELACSAQPAIQALRLGARCSIGSRQVELDVERFHTVSLAQARALVNLCHTHFRSSIDAGEQAEASRTLLDLLQFARDVGESPLPIDEMLGFALLAISYEHLVEDQVWRAFSDASVQIIEGALDSIDRSLSQRVTNFEGELVAFVRSHERRDLGRTASIYDIESAWRFGFSYPIMMRSALDQLAEAKTNLEILHASPSLNRQSEIEAYCSGLEGHPNTIVADRIRHVPGMSLTRLAILAEIRMVRLMIADRLGENLKLDDPFGAGFVRTRTAGRIRLETPAYSRAHIEVIETK